MLVPYSRAFKIPRRSNRRNIECTREALFCQDRGMVDLLLVVPHPDDESFLGGRSFWPSGQAYGRGS